MNVKSAPGKQTKQHFKGLIKVDDTKTRVEKLRENCIVMQYHWFNCIIRYYVCVVFFKSVKI